MNHSKVVDIEMEPVKTLARIDFKTVREFEDSTPKFHAALEDIANEIKTAFPRLTPHEFSSECIKELNIVTLANGNRQIEYSIQHFGKG